MAFRIWTIFITCGTFISALPAPAGHAFIPPGPGDVRSPCPGLNALANHGFIPRNGKKMTISKLVKGGFEGMTIGPDFMTTIGGAGILSAPDPTAGSFDLDDLDEHNFPIEHDGSLSRQDHYFGDWYDFNRESYDEWIGYFGHAKTTTIESAAKAKFTRVNNSLTTDPQAVYGPREFILSYGETALYLQTMGRSITSGVARLDYIRMLFVEQRLPYSLGWTKPDILNTITLASLAAMAGPLFAASGEVLPEGLQAISLGAFQDAFAGINPVTGKLGNITGV